RQPPPTGIVSFRGARGREAESGEQGRVVFLSQMLCRLARSGGTGGWGGRGRAQRAPGAGGLWTGGSLRSTPATPRMAVNCRRRRGVRRTGGGDRRGVSWDRPESPGSGSLGGPGLGRAAGGVEVQADDDVLV